MYGFKNHAVVLRFFAPTTDMSSPSRSSSRGSKSPSPALSADAFSGPRDDDDDDAKAQTRRGKAPKRKTGPKPILTDAFLDWARKRLRPLVDARKADAAQGKKRRGSFYKMLDAYLEELKLEPFYALNFPGQPKVNRKGEEFTQAMLDTVRRVKRFSIAPMLTGTRYRRTRTGSETTRSCRSCVSWSITKPAEERPRKVPFAHRAQSNFGRPSWRIRRCFSSGPGQSWRVRVIRAARASSRQTFSAPGRET